MLALTMEWIGGDHFAIQRGEFFQKSSRRAQLTALGAFFLVVNRDSLWGAIFMLG